ncbi:putative bcs1 aaa-type ATPase [Trypanosoma cruzi]|nr:putative bcs1 aaa-type ATPase [Trypanosoma cruzi]
MGGERIVGHMHAWGFFPLSTATTVFNVLQALTNNTSISGGGNPHPHGVLLDAAMAILILALGKYVHRFLTETWPRWNLAQLRKLLSLDTAEDAAAVDVFINQPEEFVFDNELLVLALERYVSHLVHSGNQAQQGDSIRENASNKSPANLSSRLFYEAEYCYGPIALLKSSHRMSAAEMLQKHYFLFTLPADGDPTEVEPGLTIWFQKQLVKVSALREGRILPRRGGKPVMEAFIPLNFDASPVVNAFTDIRTAAENAVSNARGTDNEVGGRDYDSESLSEEDDDSSTKSAWQNTKKVFVHQAILQCTDKSKKGKERIMDFARRAYAWYTKNAVEPVERYYFLSSTSELHRALGLCPKLPSGALQRWPMRQFILPSAGFSFRNLFFEQKAQLLALLEEFKQKQGKFALPGVAHQLVILLHGMPGTGKSAIVRNIASFLDRHIVALPIEHIQTDSALRGVLSGAVVITEEAVWKKETRGGSMRYEGSAYLLSQSQRLDVSKVVYLFEDIEAISDLLSFQLPVKHQQLLSDPKDVDEGKEGVEEMEMKMRTKREETTTANVSHNKAGNGSSKKQNKLRKKAPDLGVAADSTEKCGQLLVADFLSPEGVLTALNATLAPPGRVIVFTTSHPEKLPALFWKPGVVTLTVRLGILNASSAMDLVNRYCGASFTPSLRKRLEVLFAQCEANAVAEVMNPASLLHVLTICDDAEEVLRELERFC